MLLLACRPAARWSRCSPAANAATALAGAAARASSTGCIELSPHASGARGSFSRRSRSASAAWWCARRRGRRRSLVDRPWSTASGFVAAVPLVPRRLHAMLPGRPLWRHPALRGEAGESSPSRALLGAFRCGSGRSSRWRRSSCCSCIPGGAKASFDVAERVHPRAAHQAAQDRPRRPVDHQGRRLPVDRGGRRLRLCRRSSIAR